MNQRETMDGRYEISGDLRKIQVDWDLNASFSV
jgi:hypothetical protein